MPDTVRYPDLRNTTEATEVVTLFMNQPTLLHGANATFTNIGPLRQASIQPRSSAFVDLVVEFTGSAAVVLGDGAGALVALFGEIDFPDGSFQRYTLGILGISLTTGLMPQIPIINDGAGNILGFSQIIQAAAAYDWLGVGGLNGDIATGGPLVTCKIRPLVLRSFPG